MTGVASRRLPLALLMAVAIGPRSARGDVTKSQCVDANSNGQSLRLDGKLTAARHELQVCSDPACPAIVRTDCAQRMEELDRAQPTILFEVKDGSGADLIAVNVTLDGQSLTDEIGGTALRVDPGPHTFVFAVAGQDPVTRSFVIREGEKGRRERIVIGPRVETAAAPVPVSAPLAAPPPPEPQTVGLGTQKILGLTAGSLGLAGLAVGTVFGVLTFTTASAQNGDCSVGDCPNRAGALSEHATGSTEGAVSTAAFIAGGVLLVTGATLFFTARSHRAEHPSITLAPGSDRAFGGISLRGDF